MGSGAPTFDQCVKGWGKLSEKAGNFDMQRAIESQQLPDRVVQNSLATRKSRLDAFYQLGAGGVLSLAG